MMLKEKIKNDMKEALKGGDAFTRTLLGTLLSVVKNRELEKRSKLIKAGTKESELESKISLTDDEVIEIISSEIKKRKESVTTFEQGGRQDLADNEKKEVETLVHYMPEQLSDEEVRGHVLKAIEELGASGPKDMGKVIGRAMAVLKGKTDGQTVSSITKELLS